jgi:hypothetical protein
MFPRRLLAACIIAVLVVGVAAPASASVTYDPGPKTGFADRTDVEKAFRWTGAQVVARASGLTFDHQFWTDDDYTVTCGSLTLQVVHHRDYGRYELTDTVVYATRGDSTVGYHGRLLGFRLDGPHAGISGTSVPPAPGQPCPQDQAPGLTIGTARLVATRTGWSLTARSGGTVRVLRSAAVADDPSREPGGR